MMKADNYKLKTEDRRPKTEAAPSARLRVPASPRLLVSPSPRLRVPVSPRPRVSPSLRARGFSFTEILFAIMILGIGFIMVAAMFPVAIQQTENSRQESVGAAVARSGVGYIQQMANISFIQSLPAPANPPGAAPLCALRPTVVFTGNPQIWDDQALYNAVYLNTANLGNALPTLWTATPGTYVIQGEVWDFNPVLQKYFGSETLNQLVDSQGNRINLPSAVTLTSLLSTTASENMVQTSDPRFAWIGFYKRDLIMTVTGQPGATTLSFAYAPSAQVIVVATQVRNSQAYNLAVPTVNPNPLLDIPSFPNNQPLDALPSPASLEASRTNLSTSGANPAVITPPSNSTTPGGEPQLDPSITFQDSNQVKRAAEGAFVIIAADPPSTNMGLMSGKDHGKLNGRIYRLGAADLADDPSGATWKFAPGYGPSASDLTLMAQNAAFKFLVYIVGKGQDPDSGAPGTYIGAAQDIAVYSTFISCPNN